MGKICTFFGHRDIYMSSDLEERLTEMIIDLIEYHGVDEFWLGGYSTFDNAAFSILHHLKAECYPHIHLCFVFSYSPSERKMAWYDKNYDSSFCPEEVYKVPKRFAIRARNKYMAKNCDFFVCAIYRQTGGAYVALKVAQHHKKIIFNLSI